MVESTNSETFRIYFFFLIVIFLKLRRRSLISTMFKRKTLDPIESKVTPDFNPMIRIIFWNSLGFFFFQFLIPYVVAQLLEASGPEMGFSFASQTFGGLLSAPLVGYLTDRISKKKLVLIGSFGRGICYILMFLGIIYSSLIIFSIGLFVQGFFVGFFWTPLDALISQKSYKTHRSSAFGKRAGMIGKGNLVGSAISFLIFSIAVIFVPKNTFLVYCPLLLFAVSNFYGGITFHRKVDESLTYDRFILELENNQVKSNQLNEYNPLKNSDSHHATKLGIGFFLGFIFLLIAFMTSNMNQSLAQPFFQIYLIDVLKVENPILVMLIYFPSQILAQLFAPKLGKIADKINPMVGIAIISSLGSFVTFLIINTNSGWIFGIILLFDSTFAWTGNLILQNVLSRISKSHRGKIFGATQWMSLFGAILGPILGGFVWAYLGPQSPFIISIFVELSVIPLYIIAIKSLKKYMAEKVD